MVENSHFLLNLSDFIRAGSCLFTLDYTSNTDNDSVAKEWLTLYRMRQGIAMDSFALDHCNEPTCFDSKDLEVLHQHESHQTSVRGIPVHPRLS